MLKKATILLIVFTLVVSFSMTAMASGATVTECDGTDCDYEDCDGDGHLIIENPANPVPNENAEENGNGQGPHNPIYVAGE